MLFLPGLFLLAQAPAPAARLEQDVLYRTVDAVELRLDALLPPGDGPHPALLLVHGGAWMHGNKRDMRAFAELFVQQGYACFSVQYRLAPAHRWPGQIEDCLAAVQFVRSEAQRFHVDPTRLGALGLSAGGHLVALLGVLDERADPASPDSVRRQSSRVQCVVDYFGPVLLARTKEHDFDTQPPPELFGDAPDSEYAAASPLNFVTRDDTPFLLVHGDADDTVPVGHSHLMDEKLREAGVACELVVIPGGGHGDFFRKDPRGEYWKRTEAFLAARLKPATAR
ncbi:MAG: alpha/beta hydrolase [Planctomycetes bacterium]|nr:alpha/beta hydrolase [Planctomycetota bacterium]